VPAVQVQIARLERRLDAFARVQAEERLKGWVIEHVEQKYEGEPALDVPEQAPMPLSGKIDRIDRNERTGAWRIIDYKTSDKGTGPYATHHGKKKLPKEDAPEWCDLQLPLYRYLARDDVEGEPELAYILLPNKPDNTAVAVAEWRPVQLDSALDVARGIVRAIRGGSFDVNRDYHRWYDDFARICQVGAFGADPEEGAA
jgi:ATP-dependent helicase/nuclease subunit B